MSFEDLIRNRLEEEGFTLSDFLIDLAEDNFEATEFLADAYCEFELSKNKEVE